MGKQVTELDALPSFTDNSLLPVHNGAGLKKGLLSQLASYLGTKFSNPNLLINPDFKINQRGATSYEQQGYSVDRWKIWNVTVTPNSNGSITIKNDKYTDTGTFIQILENATEGDSTLSCYVTSVTGTVTMFADDNTQVVLKQGLNVVHTSSSTKNFSIFLNRGTSITLKWAKLEQGKVATSFIVPNMAEELAKCYRFYQRMKPHYSGYVAKFQTTYFPIPIKAQTRAKGTITVSDQQNSYNITGVSTTWSVGSDDYNKCPYIGFTTDLDGYARLNCIVEIDAEIY